MGWECGFGVWVGSVGLRGVGVWVGLGVSNCDALFRPFKNVRKSSLRPLFFTSFFRYVWVWVWVGLGVGLGVSWECGLGVFGWVWCVGWECGFAWCGCLGWVGSVGLGGFGSNCDKRQEVFS
ncbi:unnamed protein product [Rhizophagus irregularis]|nr:unnamed protein product [Rhizophagus irregularis]